MSSDTITLDYTITPTISTVDSGYVTTSSITGLNPVIYGLMTFLLNQRSQWMALLKYKVEMF